MFLIKSFSKDLEDEDDPFEKHKMKTALKDRCYLSEVYTKLKDKGKEELADQYAVRYNFHSYYSTKKCYIFFSSNYSSLQDEMDGYITKAMAKGKDFDEIFPMEGEDIAALSKFSLSISFN